MRRPHLPPDRVLDRPGLRWFVSLRRTVMISLAQRRLCLVRRRGGIASIRYPNGMVVPLSMPRTPEQLAESAETFFPVYLPRAGDVVVDAGAGIGDELLVLAKLVGKSGRVVAVEAHPASFARLESLCRLNRLDQVACVHAALLDKPGTVYITDLKRALSNTVMTGDGTIPVPADTLDNVLGRLGVARVDFLKMNIEGAELRALEGFERGLPSVQNLAVACHDRRADRGESEAFRTRPGVRALLESAGLEVVESPRDEHPWDRDYLFARARPD